MAEEPEAEAPPPPPPTPLELLSHAVSAVPGVSAISIHLGELVACVDRDALVPAMTRASARSVSQ